MTEYRMHDVALMYPQMAEDEYRELVEDIRQNGLITPIWVMGDYVIDGRHRYLACKELGIEPQVQVYTGNDDVESLVDFVRSLNEIRRNLTTGQRATLAVKIKHLFEEEAKKRQRLSGGDTTSDDYNKAVQEKIPEPKKGQARDKAAEKTGTNGRYVSDMERVRETDVELFEAVDKGKLNVLQAKKIASLDEKYRKQAVKRVQSQSDAEDVKEVATMESKRAEAVQGKEAEFVDAVYALDLESKTDIEWLYEWYLKRVDEASKYYTVCDSGYMQLDGEDFPPVRFKDSTSQQKRDFEREHAKWRRGIEMDNRRQERIERITELSQGNEELNQPKRYPVIYADPPWRYEFAETQNRAIENHYPTMEIDEICALPVATLATDDSVLFLWATTAKLVEAMRVIDAWGFVYKTSAVWIKDKIGMGYYFRGQHELLLVATRGNLPVPEPSKRHASVVQGERTDHSAKPHVFYQIIENMYPEYAKIELFARNTRRGWDGWGNQYNDGS